MKKRGVKQKVSSSKKAEKPVLPCCIACHSPSVEVMIVDGREQFLCQRCGHVSKLKVEKDMKAIRHHHIKRKRQMHVRAHHHKRKRQTPLYAFAERFHLRMFFKIISTMFIGFGVVLLTTTKPWTGVLFLLVGLVGFVTSFRFFR